MTSAVGDSGSTGGGSRGSGSSGGRSATGRRAGAGKRSRSDQARLVLAAALGGLAVAFALLNTNHVEVDWILGTWSTPLIVVILVSLLIGAVLGFVIGRRR